LEWQVHGGGPTGIVVERRIDEADSAKESWRRIAKLPATATEYAIPVSNGGSGSLTGCAQSMEMASLLIPTSDVELFQLSHNRE
jgi:hypothetical protein